MTRIMPLGTILTVFIFNPVYSHTSLSSLHKIHAQEWVAQLTKTSQKEDIQLAANILYLLYANALIDTKIHQLIIPITRLTQIIRNNIANYKITTNELATLKTLTDRLSFVTSARIIYNKTLETCLNYCNTNMSHEVNNVILDFESYGQESLNNYAQENTNEMSKQLELSTSIINEEIRSLQTISNFQTAISNGAYANFIKENEPTNNSIAIKILDRLHHSNNIAIQHTEYLLNTFDDSTNFVMNLYSHAIEIIKLHYEELYTYISSESYGTTYAKTLFGMNELLPEEYQSMLPTTELVFEHILKTIKLYTKIELISQQQKDSL